MVILDIRFLSRNRVALAYPTGRIPVAPLEDEKSASNATGKRAAFPPRRSLAVAPPKAINDEPESRHSTNRPHRVRKVANRSELFKQKRKFALSQHELGKPPGSTLDRV